MVRIFILHTPKKMYSKYSDTLTEKMHNEAMKV